jgi:sarcosine oxidase gamma subunit
MLKMSLCISNDQIDVFRSFARAFWKSLCHASEEVGYEVQ